MSLVRNDHSAAYLRDAVSLDLGDIAEEGRMIREKANQEAQRIVTDAQEKVSQILALQQEEGFRRGHKDGYQAGFGKGVEEGRTHAISQMSSDIEITLQSWNEALTQFRSVRERLQQEAKHNVLKLALDMGKKIIYRMTELDPTIIETQLEETLHLLATKTTVKIQVNPSDLETAQVVLPSILEQSENCNEMIVVADRSIYPGGCFVHTETGDIDARIETQIRRIVETLLPQADEGLAGETAERAGNDVESDAEPGRLSRSDDAVDSDAGGSGFVSGDAAQSTLVDSFLSDSGDDADLDVNEEASDTPEELNEEDGTNGVEGT